MWESIKNSWHESKVSFLPLDWNRLYIKCELFTMRPSTMPKLSLMTLARGARQLVVHEALLWRRDGENMSHIQTVHSYWHQTCTDTQCILRDDLGFDIRVFFFWQGTETASRCSHLSSPGLKNTSQEAGRASDVTTDQLTRVTPGSDSVQP